MDLVLSIRLITPSQSHYGHLNIQNRVIEEGWRQAFLPKKGLTIFSCLDLTLWQNVYNIFGDDFVLHHLLFYEIF